jgi:hypothetical protein
LIRVGVFTKQCSSSGSSDYDINNSENMNTIMESIEEKYVNEKNHFFNYLSDFKTINIDSLNNIDTLKTGDRVFKSMYSSKFEEQIPDSLKINIKNKSDFDIVVLISDKVNPNSNFNQPRYSVFLKKKESIWKMGNVAPQDLVVVPPVLSGGTSNAFSRYSLDYFTKKENQKQLPFDLKNQAEADRLKEFLTSISTAGANKTYVLNFKNGDTEMISKDELLNQFSVADMAEIESIAPTNTIEDFSKRRRDF